MDDNTNIDDLFRSEIEPFRMEPSEKSWNSLQTELAKKRSAAIRKRRLGWFSASVFLLILSYTSYKYFSSESSSDKKLKNNIEINTEGNTIDNSSINNTAPINNNTLQNSAGSITRKESAEENSNSTIENTTENQKTSPEKLPTASENISHYSVRITSENQKKTPAEPSTAKLSSVKSSTAEPKIVNDKQALVSGNISSVVHKRANKSAVKTQYDNTKQTKSKTDATLIEKPSVINSISKSSEKSNSTEASAPFALLNEKASDNTAENKNLLEKPGIISATDKSLLSENSITKINTVESKQEIKSEISNSNPKTESEKSKLPEIISDQKIKDNDIVVNNASKQEAADEKIPSSLSQPHIKSTEVAKDTPPAQEITKTVESDKSVAINAANNTNATIDTNAANKDKSISFFKKLMHRLSADIYYSPDYVKSSLKSNDSYTGSASKNPADYADQAADFSYSTGFNLGFDITKKWSIRSGISFSTFSQSAVYNTIQVISDSVYKEVHGHHGSSNHQHNEHHNHQPPNQNNDHHYVIHTPCGAIDLLQEPTEFSHGGSQAVNGQTVSFKTETSETIHFLYIPVTVRYEFGKRKLSYFVEGGGAFNLVKKDIVKVTVNDSYVEDNNFDGLNSFNYSLLLGAGVNYNFYKGLSTFLKPSLRYSITPINDNNPLYSYPYYLGIGAGFSIHF
jgi:hypothetical protein